ncbi:hypothetical protein C9439_07310 [archaeon SCG-AAA382B04]|nr:hypothetical protein C9439_07310 [archaeon SCG-AAA382B04]
MNRNLETSLFLFSGIWSFGIGFRLFLELINTREFILIPSHPINIYFDFLILMVSGMLLIYYGYLRYMEGYFS